MNNEYIIHAVKDEYYFRIKSLKETESVCKKNQQLKVDKYYQLDIRNFSNVNNRTLYSTKYVAMGFCEVLENGQELCEYNPKVLNTFSQVLNLKELYLIPNIKINKQADRKKVSLFYY